jgi:hypothetical protein
MEWAVSRYHIDHLKNGGWKKRNDGTVQPSAVELHRSESCPEHITASRLEEQVEDESGDLFAYTDTQASNVKDIIGDSTFDPLLTYNKVGLHSIIAAGLAKAGAAHVAACIQRKICEDRDGGFQARKQSGVGGAAIILRGQVRFQECVAVTGDQGAVGEARRLKQSEMSIMDTYVGGVRTNRVPPLECVHGYDTTSLQTGLLCTPICPRVPMAMRSSST